MTQKVKLKRSAVQGKVPLTTDIELGEVAINTYDGKLFLKKNNGTDAIVEVGALSNTGVTAGTYKSVTVDAKGRVTAGTNPTTIAGYGITDAVSTSTIPTFSGGSGGFEGGEIRLAKAPSSTTLTNDVIIDVIDSKIRFFENGGSFRGAYLDFTEAGAGVTSNLLRPSYANISGKPTTIAGYGITDAYTKSEVDSAVVNSSTPVLMRKNGVTPFVSTSVRSMFISGTRCVFASVSGTTLYLYAGTLNTAFGTITLGAVATKTVFSGSLCDVKLTTNDTTGLLVYSTASNVTYAEKFTFDANNAITFSGSPLSLGVNANNIYMSTLINSTAVAFYRNSTLFAVKLDGTGTPTASYSSLNIAMASPNSLVTLPGGESVLVSNGTQDVIIPWTGSGFGSVGTLYSHATSLFVPPSWAHNAYGYKSYTTAGAAANTLTGYSVNVSDQTYTTDGFLVYSPNYMGGDDKIHITNQIQINGWFTWRFYRSKPTYPLQYKTAYGEELYASTDLTNGLSGTIAWTATSESMLGYTAQIRKSDINGTRFYLYVCANSTQVHVITYNG